MPAGLATHKTSNDQSATNIATSFLQIFHRLISLRNIPYSPVYNKPYSISLILTKLIVNSPATFEASISFARVPNSSKMKFDNDRIQSVRSDRDFGIIALKSLLLKSPTTSHPSQIMKCVVESPVVEPTKSKKEKSIRDDEVAALKSLLLSPQPVFSEGQECFSTKVIKKSLSPSSKTPSPSKSESGSVPCTPKLKHRKKSDISPPKSGSKVDLYQAPYFAGSAFLNSPCPEAVPLPDFDEHRNLEFEENFLQEQSTLSKTQSLRLLLKL
eukprot:gene11762-24662_t